MTRKCALLFDLDGTLANTLADIADAFNTCLRRMGEKPRPVDDYRMLVGDGIRVLCGRVLADPSADRVDELVEMVVDHYDRHLLERTRLYPGVAELLGRLRRARIPMAVLSNKPDRHTRGIVDALVPAGTFEIVLGHREGAPRKPDPSTALRIAAEMNVRPEECILVGDSAVDMRTARAAGMKSVGVLWGFRGRRELEKEGASLIVNEPKEIAALVLEPRRRD